MRGHEEIRFRIADGKRLRTIDTAQLAKTLDTLALVQARRHNDVRPRGADLVQVERRGHGDMREESVVRPHQTQPGFVKYRLRLGIVDLAAHTDRDLAVLVAGRHVVVVFDALGPAVDDLLAHVCTLDDLVRRETTRRIVGHVGGEVLPFAGLQIEHKQAAHLADIGIETENAGVFLQHRAIATGAGNDLDTRAFERDHGFEQLGAGIALVIAQGTGTGSQHRGVEVGENVPHVGELFAQITGWMCRQDRTA